MTTETRATAREMIRLRTRARARAVQAVYAWDVLGDQPLDRVASRLWDDLALGADVRARATELVRTVAARAAEVDAALRDVTTNWRLERLGVIERSVLRVAAAELALGDTPPKVVTQEAVRLAERFGSEASARFVNGVVDALARRMGRL
jgi:transcription antitermination protein NusB